MIFPVWEVPYLGNGWMIGLTAILHVFVSHFAIGGGAFIALTEQLAYQRNDANIYAWLKKHGQFFLLITAVLGVVTGVGIWWSTSLANPAGIQTLLQNFSLFWASEYIFFLLEIATFFAWYYTYDKIDRKTHLAIAWIYVAISFMTLFTINGILTFMLTSGGWPVSGDLWAGYFNPAFWPALFIRLFIMLALAGVYALLTASRIKGNEPMRSYLLRYSAKWMLPALMLGPVFLVWFLYTMPEATQNVILSGLATMGEGNFSIMARTIIFTIIMAASLLLLTFIGPFLNPKKFTPTFAAFVFLSAFAFMVGEEWAREMMRKPYVIYDYMYSNGLRKNMISEVNEKGFFNVGNMASAEFEALEALPNDDMTKGKLMFRYQCMSCHTPSGYRSMERLLGTRDEQAINSLLEVVSQAHKKDNPYHGIMPPVVGKPEERAALAKYLVTMTKSYKAEQEEKVALANKKS